MTNKTYDILKWVAVAVLPALATFLLAVAGIWDLPVLDPVAATVTALNAALGVVLGISSNTYKKEIE